MKYLTDHAIATLLWVAVVIVCGSGMVSMWVSLGLIAAASANLLHARYVEWSAGLPFTTRVREVLAEDLAANASRLSEVERLVGDVKDAQITIAGQFRGAGSARMHP